MRDPTVALLPSALQAAGTDFGIYGVEYLPLAAGAIRQSSFFKVQEDHAFLIEAGARLWTTTGNAFVGAGAQDETLCLVNMYVRASNRASAARTVPGANDAALDNFFGTGQQPAYWAFPEILRPNDILVVEVTNLDGANARNLRLSFLGQRLMRAAAADPFAFARDRW